MKKTYGLGMTQKRTPQRPVEMKLTGEEGARVVMSAAKRVIATHEKVIEALAKR